MPKGLVKAKKYDWKDTNLAMFGSDTEKQVKKDSALTEPAWEGAGAEVGLQVWRIKQFQVTHVPASDYGRFHKGDSYIVLNTYKLEGEDELKYDVHFWIGSKSTQDEYATAAYKTVELDTRLDDKAVQHREVMGNEAELFLSYFKTVVILEGGYETGFRHVVPEEYPKRLLHFSGKRTAITVKEVPATRERLNSGDVYILDTGTELYQWNGEGCNKDERIKAMQFLMQLKSDRACSSQTYDQISMADNHSFYDLLDADDEDDDDETDGDDSKILHRVSDSHGELQVTPIKEGNITIDDFEANDVFLLDVGTSCFVWVGSGASEVEKKNGLGVAHLYLKSTGHPVVPITVVKQGQTSAAFEAAVAA